MISGPERGAGCIITKPPQDHRSLVMRHIAPKPKASRSARRGRVRSSKSLVRFYLSGQERKGSAASNMCPDCRSRSTSPEHDTGTSIGPSQRRLPVFGAPPSWRQGGSQDPIRLRISPA